MKLIRVVSILPILLVAIFFEGCSDHVSDTINEAYESFNEGRTVKARELVRQLIKENKSTSSVYDKANMGLAALYMGVECKDFELAEVGYMLSSEALSRNRKECDEMIESENYITGDAGSFAEVVRILYSQLQNIELSNSIVGSWQTTYSEYFYNETQEFTETLTLNSDNSFEEHNLIFIKMREGDFDIKCQAQATVSGKWAIDDNVLTLRYNARTLSIDLVPGQFKMALSDRAFFTGDIFASLLTVSENEVKANIRNRLFENLNEAYQSTESSFGVTLEDGDMLLRTYTNTYTYTRSD